MNEDVSLILGRLDIFDKFDILFKGKKVGFEKMKFEEFRKRVEIRASVRPSRYVVAKVKDCPQISEKIFAIIKDRNETTVIAENTAKLNTIEEEKFFKIISF
jgi:hypothetical protein